MRNGFDGVEIPGGTYSVGSTRETVERCVEQWSGRLISPSYGIEEFRRWILKEYPRHDVVVTPFTIGRYPVTNEEYGHYMRQSGALPPPSVRLFEPGDHPVWGVSFEEAAGYASWLGRKLGCPCALPTEIQWEIAARGPTDNEFPFGDHFEPEACNTIESGLGHTTPVDAYPTGVSCLGVYDMGGNVEEWTSSRYAAYPGGTFIEDDIVRHVGPSYPVVRGGSFALGGDLARCARRHGPHPGPEFQYRGFRVAITSAESE